MCGIAGFWGEADHGLLERMTRVQSHRGPDDEGFFEGETASLGFRRLSIIDLARGAQPMASDDGRFHIVFNGEIYNFPELRRELEGLGERFRTASDTEVILRGYLRWGADVLNKLLGMFAFAIYDAAERELFLARDRLGIKPLYFVESPRFAFASEIKALLCVEGVRREVDRAVLARFLRFRVHDDSEDTFFAGVKRLLPGHYMIVGNGTRTVKRYWTLDWDPELSGRRSDDDYAAEFAELFDTVVRRHLISDVPLGFNLSGGLDSSGVVCTAARLMREGADTHTGGKLFTFSALYPGETIDESRYIHEVERFANTTPVYAQPSPDEFWNEIGDWVRVQEEPTISSAPYAYYCVYRVASKHVKVSMSGNGGDELLAGYLPYLATLIHQAADGNRYARAAGELLRGVPVFYRQYLEQLATTFGRRSVAATRLLGEKLNGFRSETFTIPRNLNERLVEDLTHRSTPNLLRYEDKNSMAFGIEARVPFLDSELVEFVCKLPADQKIKHGMTRFVYRNAMRGRIPELNRTRRSKIGFTNPEAGWLRHNGRHIREIFRSRAFADRGLFAHDEISASFDRWLAGAEKIDSLHYWRILVTELWIRTFEIGT